MPEQMMHYRAAAFFARAFVPEELLGMQTVEELEDIAVASPEIRNVTPAKTELKVSKPAPSPEKAAETPADNLAQNEQDEQDKPKKPATTRKKRAQDAPSDEELLLKASLDEMEAALNWLDKSLMNSGASWNKVYRICDVIGAPHPAQGASREEMADFALSVRCDEVIRKALEDSGVIFEKE